MVSIPFYCPNLQFLFTVLYNLFSYAMFTWNEEIHEWGKTNQEYGRGGMSK